MGAPWPTYSLALEEIQIVPRIGPQHSPRWPWALHSLRCGSGCCRPGWAFKLTWLRWRAGAGLRPCRLFWGSRWLYGAFGISDGRDTEHLCRLLRRRG